MRMQLPGTTPNQSVPVGLGPGLPLAHTASTNDRRAAFVLAQIHRRAIIARAIMKRTQSAPLTDDELRPLLEARDVISFVGQPVRFEEIERQVERLGFGDLYLVSMTLGPHSAGAKISLRPEALATSATADA